MCVCSLFSLETRGRFRCRVLCYSGKRDQRQNYSLPSSITLTISTNAYWLTTCRRISIIERGKICETKKTCLLKEQRSLGYGFPIIKSSDILLTPFLGLHLVVFKVLHFISIFFFSGEKILMTPVISEENYTSKQYKKYNLFICIIPTSALLKICILLIKNTFFFCLISFLADIYIFVCCFGWLSFLNFLYNF